MTVLLWVLLALSVICTLGMLAAWIYAAADGKITNLDYALMPVGCVTLVVDVIGGAAGVTLATVVLDDSGGRALAGWLTAVPLGLILLFVTLHSIGG